MDDFKTSTRAILEAVRGEKARIKKRLEALDEREATILKWIEQEEGPVQEELPSMPNRPVIAPRQPKPTLQELFREVMQDGKPHTNAELSEIAKMRGLLAQDADLRGVHSVMMSIMNMGEVYRRGDAWVLRKGGS